MKRWMIIAALAAVAAGCSGVKQVVVKDIPLEQQQALLEKYRGRSAWCRTVLEDMGEGGSVPRDTKVKIVDVGMVYQGTVTVQTLRRKKRIVQSLDLERPLTVEKIETRLAQLFWFQDPILRHVDYIRRWGKKVARAVMEHHVFIGMPAEAALESWGYPAKRNVNEIGGKREEQWVYPAGDRKKYIYVREGKVFKWDE